MIHYILHRNDNYNSDATYNRVRLICQGLTRCQVNVKFHLLILPQNSSLFDKGIVYLRDLFRLLFLLLVTGKKDVVIFYGNTFFYYLYPLFCKKTNLVIEHNDYPFHEIIQNINKSYLKDYFGKLVNDIYICPLVVDLDEFVYSKGQTNAIDGEYIAYCGNLNNEKDGVMILFDAFRSFHIKYPNMKLVLIGNGENEFVNNLKEKIIDNDLRECVIIKGPVPHDEVCNWLVNATILALARPSSRQAEGGIPSKVGEYLASGVPCVITRTGDLPLYLNDGIDCFLCNPDSVELFTERLEQCYLSDRTVVGEMGRKSALQFSNIVQAKHLIDYLERKYNISLKA